ncbi:hypothetical protein TSUD_60230 [Trifolium subterraneum]|uniref:Myb-like domain-containing protein n=1 Tax=Trifolium subterraneum TaxID=3900 RepID=A0A2Z6N769_TRISU|nr:hypothetical protein TSUD_60230 [Trifolium subterraneum]
MASSSVKDTDNIEYFPNWTRKQQKQFDAAWVIHHDKPDIWEKIAQAVDDKSAEVKIYYEKLVELIKNIEAGNVPIPKYPEDEF